MMTLSQIVEIDLSALDFFMQSLSFGVLFVTIDQEVLFANRWAKGLLKDQDGLRLNGDKLEVVNPICRQKFETHFQAMKSHQAFGSSPSSSYLEVDREADRAAFSVAIFRLPTRRPSTADAPQADFVIAIDSDGKPDLHSSVLQGKYMLSLQEARIVNLLLSGIPLSQISNDLNITRETARWYMREIFRKMKTNRQQDLIRKLASDATLFAFSQDL